MLDYDKLLSPENKRQVVEARLWEEGAPLDSRVQVVYDRRYAWDFAVVRDTETGYVTVTFSMNISGRRFHSAIRQCAQAVEEVVRGKRSEVFKGEPFQKEG